MGVQVVSQYVQFCASPLETKLPLVSIELEDVFPLWVGVEAVIASVAGIIPALTQYDQV